MTSASVKMALDSSAVPRTLLLRLKDETGDVHESLERGLDLLRPDLTLERYRQIVERFYGFYLPWENAVTPLLLERLPGFSEPRMKVPKLLDDLKYLGVRKPASLPLCRRMPNCVQWPNVLGGLYVIEGATLGGQIVSRRLEQSLGLSVRCGTSFFASYGLQVGSMWRSFCATLQAHTPVEREDMIVRAARETFTSMHTWLSP